MRSQYLTLLCILTFLSCGWGLADSAVSFFQTDAVSETTYVKDSSKEKKKEKKTETYYEDRSSGDAPTPSDPVQVKLLAIAQFMYSILTLIGAVLMFRLQRIGFWVYVAGTAVGLVLPIVLGGFAALNTSFGAFFSMIFVGLYWVSLKEMR